MPELPPCGCRNSCEHRDHPQFPAQRSCRFGFEPVPRSMLRAESAKVDELAVRVIRLEEQLAEALALIVTIPLGLGSSIHHESLRAILTRHLPPVPREDRS